MRKGLNEAIDRMILAGEDLAEIGRSLNATRAKVLFRTLIVAPRRHPGNCLAEYTAWKDARHAASKVIANARSLLLEVKQ